VEALRTDNGWQEYRLRAVRDELLDQGAQTAEGLCGRHGEGHALGTRRGAAEGAKDLAAMQVVAAERVTTLASAQAQLQQDRATLEGARSW
jgi:hypothetical protein